MDPKRKFIKKLGKLTEKTLWDQKLTKPKTKDHLIQGFLKPKSLKMMDHLLGNSTAPFLGGKITYSAL